MKNLMIQKGTDSKGTPGLLIRFNDGERPVFVAGYHWIGVDFDGTLARNNNINFSEPPYPLGEPIQGMVEVVKALLDAGVTVKIFTARAARWQDIPMIQDWTERHGLGRPEVTDRKDFNMVRFFDDRAIAFQFNI